VRLKRQPPGGFLQVKLWDVASEQPTLVASSDVGVGALFSAAFCAESPFLVAAGGAKVRRSAPRCRAHPVRRHGSHFAVSGRWNIDIRPCFACATSLYRAPAMHVGPLHEAVPPPLLPFTPCLRSGLVVL